MSKHQLRGPRGDRNSLLCKDGSLVSGKELAERHREAAESGEYGESELHEAVMFVLYKNQIEFKSEYELDNPARKNLGKGNHKRRCDLYIPETDTAVELKHKANLRGLGQAAYYAHMHKEAVLLVENHEPGIARVARSIPAVNYGQVLPGPLENPPKLAVSSDSRCRFFFESNHGQLGDDDWFIKKPEPDAGVGSGRNRTLSEYECHGTDQFKDSEVDG